MRIRLRHIMDDPILAGAGNGKSAFAALLAVVNSEPAEPSPLFIDLSGVEIATASFLREAVFGLKNYMRTIDSLHYPAVANAKAAVLDELAVIAEARRDAIAVCDLDDEGSALNARIIGDLDAKQALTLKLVIDMNGADAAGLMERYGEAEKTTSTTAWNNRLAALANRGLIREFARGRAKYYRPIFEETRKWALNY